MVNLSDILNASILIVDDLDANVQLLERMLRGAGYTSIEIVPVGSLREKLLKCFPATKPEGGNHQVGGETAKNRMFI